MKRTSMGSGSGMVAVCLAAVGAAVAVAYVVNRTSQRKPGAVVERCFRAVDELERRLIGSAAKA